MEILRVPPFPLTTTWSLPDANYAYILYVEDLVDHSIEETTITSDENGVVSYTLPLTKVQFDRQFLVRFYDAEHEHIIYEENLDIIRPYVDPKKLGTTPSEIEEYKMYELIARSIIDTVTDDGFYNHKSIYQTQGNGLDYMPIWKDANRVLKVYHNNVLVFDIDTPETNTFTYKVTLDNSAIVKEVTGPTNIIGYNTPSLPIGSGDLIWDARNYGTFLKGQDYLFVLDEGYRAIPPDVEAATKMLIEDIKCGKLDYYKRYVNSYQTDQFTIQFNQAMMEGTGNSVVDKILSKYEKTIKKIGVL
jgi:hypothetical protein